jgi:acetyl esterase
MAHRYDPELAAVIALLPDPDLTDLAAARAMAAEFAKAFVPDLSGVDVSDVTLPGEHDIQVRVYRPAVPPVDPVPAVLNLHGGGFVMGNLAIDEGSCLDLVRSLNVVVVSVDYRLAPEHPFPAGLEDCYSALTWLAGNAETLGVDPRRIAVRGYSAGGGLAAALCLLSRDRGGPPLCFQFLGIPELDDRLDTPSMREYTDTPLWHRQSAEQSWQYYLGDGVPGGPDVSPYAAPGRATDVTGLPPTYVAVMQFDPLRDEGIAYAQSLLSAGIPTELHLFPGAFHGSAAIPHAVVSQRENGEATAVWAAALGIAHRGG